MNNAVMDKTNILDDLKQGCIEMAKMRNGELPKQTWEDFLTDITTKDKKGAI